MSPYSTSASVSVMTMVAARIGADRVSFGANRANAVSVNGVAATLAVGSVIQLSGGTLQEAGANIYVLSWNSGESMTVRISSEIDIDLSLGANARPGSVAGLFGGNNGRATDFALPDGTVLPQPLTANQLYGAFANGWRISQANALLDYGPGQTTATFTDTGFPFDVVALGSLPATVVAAAAVQTAAAAITDATIAQQAQLDFAATGDPAFLAAAQFAQSVGVVATLSPVTASATPPAAIGVSAPVPTLNEVQGGPTVARFTIYLTAPAAKDVLVNWAVTSPGAGFLAAAAFGGTLPSGVALIAQGQTTATVTVSVPAAAFGVEPSDLLQLSVTATDGTALFAPTAQVTLVNPNPEPGPAAAAAITELAGGGTFTQAGTAYTLNLGTVQQGTGPLTARIGVFNSGVSAADGLSGTFAIAGSPAFTLANFIGFGPVAGQGAFTAPLISLDTGTAGAFSTTVTLTPTDSNNTGYSLALPAETLTITGVVANLPPPVITAPSVVSAFKGVASQLKALAVSDTNDPGQPMTVVLAAAAGVLATQETGALAVSGNGTGAVTLRGSIADLNAALAALTYTSTVIGADTITLTATDAARATATQAVSVATSALPHTGAVFNAPADTVFFGRPSGLAGYSLTDPYDQAMGNVLTLTLASPNSILSVKGPSGGAAGTVTGQNTGTITITGTVDQINAQLSDDLIADLGGLNGSLSSVLAFLITAERHQLNYVALTANLKGTPSDGFDISLGPTNEGLLTVAGPEGKAFLIGVTAAVFGLNSLVAYATGGKPPSFIDLQRDLWVIVADAHIVDQAGSIYDFNFAGEFILAASNQAGDTFQVQGRLQPLPDSRAASILTQVAAQVGTDRVTFAANRAGVVWVNGTAVKLSLNVVDNLSGGELTQVSADTFKIIWNTGEALTVTTNGDYLNAQVAAGPNNTASTLFGLDTISKTPGNDFTLPDGTVLTQPLTQAQLAQFANAYRVPQQFSLLDYAAGQSTATFTDLAFPGTPLNLTSLPADVLAKAAAVVAAAGLTDPGVVAAAEFDYIASGGDARFVATDASLLAGVSTRQAGVAAPAATTAIGVLPVQSRIRAAAGAATPIQFEAYLTAAAATDTVINWQVAAVGAGFLAAADFGGTLPSGAITIAAGQTTGIITVSLPAGALGSLAQDNIALQVSSPAAVPVLVPRARASISQAVAGPPPAPQVVSLVNLGTLTQSGGAYTLDLGDVQYGGILPNLRFGIVNAAPAPADTLGGTLTATTVDGFTVTGLALPATLDAGQSYYGIDVALQYTKFGANVETITFKPTDSNGTGFSSALPTETLTIKANVVAPTMVFSKAWGDVHIVTYDGLLYDFQAVGEFTLAQSKLPNDSFDIQLRLSPYYNIIYGAVSVITETAVSLGTDRITFDIHRPGTVWVNGAVSALSADSPILRLAAGTVSQLAANIWKVVWTTGEEATVTSWGNHLDVSDGIPLSAPNFVHGLQGENAGQANDFQLSDGTVLTQPLSYAQLYGVFADSWRVTQGSSLLDYAAGQTTQTFTDRGYPNSYYDAQNLPASLQTQAAAAVVKAGITDPGLAAAAQRDFLATGDPNFIAGTAVIQQQIVSTTPVTPTAIPAPPPELGVKADPPGLVEAKNATTPVQFDVFLTQALATDTVVQYTVVDNGSGYLGAAVFGATLPSRSVTLTAGQTLKTFVVNVPVNALGTAASAALAVSITGPAGLLDVGPTAQAVLANYQSEPGVAPVPRFTDLTTPANLVAASPVAYTLNFGTLKQGQIATANFLALLNDAGFGADLLTGSFGVPTGSGFTVVGGNLAAALAGGASYGGIAVTPQTNQPGAHSERLVFTPKDVNASGYMATLPPITLTITDVVQPSAQAALNSPGMVVFPNVRVGTPESQALSVSNTATAPAGTLNVKPSTTGNAIVTGAVAGLAPGKTDASSITVGVGTATAGQMIGSVVLASASVATDGTAVALAAAPQVDVFGSVFRQAAPAITAPVTVLHVGDPGVVTLKVANTAAADGFSENLVASLGAVTGGLAAAGVGPTTAIAAGASNSTLGVSVSTAAAGVVSGTATVNLVSDGGTGAGSIDGLGQQALAPVSTPITVTIDNFAQAGLSSSGPALVAAGTGAYTLDLGTLAAGQVVAPIAIGALNSAAGPADQLNGTFTVNAAAGFANTGFAAFGALAAGTATTAGTVGVDTSLTGAHAETIILHPTDTNASGFSLVQADQTLTVRYTVAGSGPARRLAAASVVPVIAAPIVHVGDVATVALRVGNTASADSTPENLVASLASVSAGLMIAVEGPTAPVGAGTADTSLRVQVDTHAARVIAGTATVALVSDGGTGPGSIDGLGQTPLAPVVVPIGLTVDNYAQAALSETVNGVAATPSGNTLNLGTLRVGAAPVTIGLSAQNIASGPSDLLAATFLASGSSAFRNALAAVSGIAAGQSAAAGSITLDTSVAGTFSETVTVTPTGSNASLYSAALAAQTLTITGSVTADGAPPPAAPPLTIALIAPQGGAPAQRAIVNSPNPIVAGAAGPGAAVTLRTAGADAGATGADLSSGAYQAATTAALPQGTNPISAHASNANGTSADSSAVSAFVIPSPVDGTSTPDLASIDFGRLFDAGYVLQFVTGTEAAELVDGRLSVGPDTNEAYIQRLYEGLLGRSNEPTGITYWDHLLNTGSSKLDIANGFLLAPEFVTDHGPAASIAPAPFITLLYAGLLGRAPTTGDMTFWTAQLAQTGQAAVLLGIADSPEAKVHLAPTTAKVWARDDAGTLTHELYQTGLAREVEIPSGLSFWKAYIATHTVQQTALGVSQSVEFQADHAAQDDATYVRSLFGSGLGRDPLATEAQPLVAALQSGTASRADVLLQVATSAGAVINLTRNL